MACNSNSRILPITLLTASGEPIGVLIEKERASLIDSDSMMQNSATSLPSTAIDIATSLNADMPLLSTVNASLTGKSHMLKIALANSITGFARIPP